MALTRTKILAEVYRAIDETSGSSYFTDSDVYAYVQREQEHIGANYPVRLAAFRIKGDGTTNDFRLPEPLHKVLAMEEGNTFTPPRTFIDTIGAGGLRTTLTRDIFSSYGVSFRPPDRIKVESTLGSGETRTLWAYGHPGYINALTITASSVTVTKNSITITASTTSSTASSVHLDTVKITKSGVDEYYILDKANGGTAMLLTEPYKGSTSAAATVTIGDSTYLTEDWLDLICHGAVMRLNRKEKDFEMANYMNQEYKIEKRRKRAQLSRIAKMGSERFHSF